MDITPSFQFTLIVTVLKDNVTVEGAKVLVEGLTVTTIANGTAIHDNSGNKFACDTSVMVKVKCTGCFAQEKNITFRHGDPLVREETFAMIDEGDI